MVKSIKIFLLFLLVSSCKQKEITLISDDKVQVMPFIADTVNNLLKTSDCYPVEVTKKGYCNTTDTSISTHYFRKNSVSLSSSRDTSKLYDFFSPYFAYAYLQKDSISIILQRNNNGNNSNNLIFQISKSNKNTFSIQYLILDSDDSMIKLFTHKSELILDKENYIIGDTIRGRMLYQGVFKQSNGWLKQITYFKCVVGKSTNPLDYLDTYPPCEGIVTEVGFGKSRNIIAPKLQVKHKKK